MALNTNLMKSRAACMANKFAPAIVAQIAYHAPITRQANLELHLLAKEKFPNKKSTLKTIGWIFLVQISQFRYLRYFWHFEL